MLRIIDRPETGSAARCLECEECTADCALLGSDAPSPQQVMARVARGESRELVHDPSPWLCFQCTICSQRCPHGARPSEVMHALRALATEALAWPGWLGRVVGRAKTTWPWLFGLPLLFLGVAFFGAAGLRFPSGPEWVFADFIPRWKIQVIFFSLAALVSISVVVSSVRFWRLLGERQARAGSPWPHLLPLLADILLHRRFRSRRGRRRHWGHLLLMGGFAASLVSAGLAVDVYALMHASPIPITHPFKIMVNISAVLLLAGGVLLWSERIAHARNVGYVTSYDLFFIATLLLTIFTGIGSEFGRFALPAPVACCIYLLHLAAVFTLIGTLPFSKFAHAVYHTLGLLHSRTTSDPTTH